MTFKAATSKAATSKAATSKAANPAEAFVWVWLPHACEPMLAGRLARRGSEYVFTYARSYLDRSDAISLYTPELPLGSQSLGPPPGMTLPGCLRDAAPDAWGQRVILAEHLGHVGPEADTGDLDMLTYLLMSGSDRIGGLDFQHSAHEYQPRLGSATLDELHSAAECLDAGMALAPALEFALLRGTPIGGARPKALLTEAYGPGRVAKFASHTDPYPVVRAEAVAMNLAHRVGLNVADSQLVSSWGKDVLLLTRFDRFAGSSCRPLMISGLTMLNLDEMFARYATYPALAEVMRRWSTQPEKALRELFARIVFNVCVGNIDDHARNHAAFWDGHKLELTPAYDLCPQPRSGEVAAQSMAIGVDGERESRLAVCRSAAGIYGLTGAQAQDVIDAQVEIIRSQWDEAAQECRLTEQDRRYLWQRQILNPFIFQ